MSVLSSPLLIITGPTGVGKTELAMCLASRAAVRLISADSVMVYQGLDIGSAKPSHDQLAEHPHDLVDIIPPHHPFDVAQFVELATQSIKKAWGEHRVPILIGGAILYLKSLLDGLDKLPSADPEIRQRIRQDADTYGWTVVHEELRSLDPSGAKLIHSNDSSRIERALEVRLMTGRSIQDFWNGSVSPLRIANRIVDIHILALIPANRDHLKERLNSRFDQMLDAGLVHEVIDLRANPELTLSCQSMRSIGYRQVWNYLDGILTKDQMINNTKAATRQLAKRQLTWLRSWRAGETHKIEVDDKLPKNSVIKWFDRAISDVF